MKAEEIEADADGWATRHVVAQMKRTDRDKDWPMVTGLGRQLWERDNPLGVLHLTDPETLSAAWPATPSGLRARLATRRPLLRALDTTPALGRLELERLLALERLVWERVNEQRHERYRRAWTAFFRQWRREEDWEWPTAEAFWQQHRRLSEAVHRHRLPPDPLAGLGPGSLVEAALIGVATVARATRDEIDQVLPPVEELLP